MASLADQAYDWVAAAVIVVIGLIVLSDIISIYVGNTLFMEMLVGGGVLAAILYKAKGIFTG